MRKTFLQSFDSIHFFLTAGIADIILDGFEGKLTTSKWAKLVKCSQDTAYRDILALVKQGVLTVNSEGVRSTSYSIVDI